ncbi:hypothetical protein MTQ00_09475 [Chryseobacterium sp. B21-037]|uniref:hypothetical protein n=1 Tax=Chryseobacterium sp. B21-037 TaxID=2926038 RepID=UPI0023591B0E|nr:hypothetical protein [Chryseobacterium sp. B21-037]MDC8104770.1 hypothetical protein [Chryseobacterium sp. B21-037]
MKKLLFTLSLAVLPLFSCSSSDNDEQTTNPTTINNSKINPPSWIMGKWTSYLGGTAYQSYTFSNGDIVMSMSGYSQSYKYIADNGGYSQTSSDTEFTFTLANGGVSQTFKFKKVTATKLNFDNGNGITEFIKE